MVLLGGDSSGAHGDGGLGGVYGGDSSLGRHLLMMFRSASDLHRDAQVRY